MSSTKRVFSEQEASEILQKAAKMQEDQGHGPSYTPGITVEELQRIAAEAGIDPAVLESAMKSDKERKPDTRLTFEMERVLQGELDPSEFDVILEALGPTHRRQGVTQVGRTVSGTIWTGAGHTTVSVNSRNGRTRLSMKANPFFAFFIVLYPLFVGSIIMSAAIAEGARAAWAVPIVWLIAMVLGSILTPMALKGHKKAAIKKMEDLETKIGEALAEKAEADEKLRQNLASPAAQTIESLAHDVSVNQGHNG